MSFPGYPIASSLRGSSGDILAVAGAALTLGKGCEFGSYEIHWIWAASP